MRLQLQGRLWPCKEEQFEGPPEELQMLLFISLIAGFYFLLLLLHVICRYGLFTPLQNLMLFFKFRN